MNRHTPRDVVFGPISKGGRGLIDLRLEQPIYHLETTIGNLRRGENAGKALMATLIGHQVVAGVSQPFYQANPNDFPYMPKHTRWSYTWSIIHEYGLNVEVFGMWTPSPRYTNDKNLMETAISDPYFKRQPWKMEIVNNCRLYSQVFTLEEIASSPIKVKKEFIDGTVNHIHEKIIFKEIQKPPRSAWNEWKVFLYRNFITGRNVLAESLGNMINSEVPQAQLQSSQKSLRHQYEVLPTVFAEIVDNIVLPEDNSLSLATAMSSSELIGASDRSLIEDTKEGGYSYSIQRYEKNECRIKGPGKVPMANNTTSLTTELYGIIAC